MKNKILLTFLLLSVLSGLANAQQLNFQGVARNGSGNALINQTIKIRLTIHDASATGVVQYSETRSVTTNAYGGFKVVIGSTGSLSTTGSMSSITWASGAKFLQVEIDPANETNFVDMGTTEMVTVPTSIYANSAGSAAPSGTAAGDLSGSYPSPVVSKLLGRTLSTTAPTSGQVLKYNGTAWVPAADDNSGTGWTLSGTNLYNSNPGFIGIGTTTPTAPLSFASSVGNKIVLWGDGSTNHYGLGVQSGQLQIYTNQSSDNIVFGYGRSTAFAERMRLNGNGYLGIGNNNPNAPLSFPAILGKKITLYPGATGDVGFGVAGNRLQIYSDNPNADVAIGYDAAGTFNERLAVKPNGAVAVMGNTGTQGQVLQSNGNNAAASWGSGTNSLYNNMYQFALTGDVAVNTQGYYELPGLDQTITLTQTSRVLFSMNIWGQNYGCFGCGDYNLAAFMSIGNDAVISGLDVRTTNNDFFSAASDLRMVTLGPGTWRFRLYIQHTAAVSAPITIKYGAAWGTRMTVIVVPQ